MATQREQIVNEFVEFYQGHPERFSIVDGQCAYFQPTNKTRCAVGHFMTEEGIQRVLTELANGKSITRLECEHDMYLRPEAKGLSTAFWSELQELHDDRRLTASLCWTSETLLTKEGEERVENLKYHPSFE